VDKHAKCERVRNHGMVIYWAYLLVGEKYRAGDRQDRGRAEYIYHLPKSVIVESSTRLHIDLQC
jgi:hypothetical protein